MDAELRELCERLRGLLAKATPGPWHRQSECPDECCWHLFRKVPDGIANTASESMADGYDGSLINNPEMTGENSALIVATVNALPRLLDTIAAQAAELEGVRWRPIETAPKDGIIDVWSGGERVANAAWCAPDYGQDKSEGWCVSDWHTTYEHTYWDRIDPQPTHWMPLPKPPAIADSGAGNTTPKEGGDA